MRVKEVLYDGESAEDPNVSWAIAVNEAIREPLSEYLDATQRQFRGVAIAAVGLGAIGIAAIVVGEGMLLGMAMLAAGILGGAGGWYYLQQREPSITVRSVEKRYWTGHVFADDGSAFIYDATAAVSPKQFELRRLPGTDSLESASDQLAALDDLPAVMSAESNTESTFLETLEVVREVIASAETYQVEAPLVADGSTEHQAINALLSYAEGAPIDVPVDIDEPDARHAIDALTELEDMALGDGGETHLDRIREQSREFSLELNDSQTSTFEALNEHIAEAADVFGMVSYHFYCPDCQLDEIDSRLSLDDPANGTFHCETCRSDHSPESVLPRHRIKDDLVNPIWDQLWIEKDDQRREVYEGIENQKNELVEREFEQRREEIRTASDRIADLRSRIRDLQTKAKAAEGTVEEVGKLMVKYERLSEARKAEFTADVEETYATIDRETERVLNETRLQEHEQLEQAEQAAGQKAALMREEKRRREIERFVAEQRLADRRTAAELNQSAAVADADLGQRGRHHREEWMVTTRGRLPMSDTINKMRMKKDRVLGVSANGGGE